MGQRSTDSEGAVRRPGPSGTLGSGLGEAIRFDRGEKFGRDEGFSYFCIPQSDLNEARFERAWYLWEP